MPQVLIRNVEASVLRKLKARARVKNRSLQAELKEILVREANTDMLDVQKALAEIRRRLAGRVHTDSGQLQAEDRER
jgi:plasmid stability protein